MSDSDSDAFQSADEGDEEQVSGVLGVPSVSPPTGRAESVGSVDVAEPLVAARHALPVEDERSPTDDVEPTPRPPPPTERPDVAPAPAPNIVEVVSAGKTSDAVPTKRAPRVSKLGAKKLSSSSAPRTVPAPRARTTVKSDPPRVEPGPVIPEARLGDLTLDRDDDDGAADGDASPGNGRVRCSQEDDLPRGSKSATTEVDPPSPPETADVGDDEDGWGSWASWGTSVVSQFTSQVTSGISTVKDVVETGLGIPDPEELARLHVRAKNEGGGDVDEETSVGPAPEAAKREEPKLFSLFGGALSAGSQILSGGLGTFEYIGKKTMEVLQENDPGLKKKRELLQGKSATLSDLLREAQEQVDLSDRGRPRQTPEESSSVIAVFEELGGLAHYEALSSLKDTLEIKSMTSSGDLNARTKALFDKYSFGGGSEDDDGDEEEEKAQLHELIESMTNFLAILDLRGVNGKKIQAIEEQLRGGDAAATADDGPCSVRFLSHVRRLLASLAAAHVEVLHRVAEALLVLDSAEEKRAPGKTLPLLFQLAKNFVAQYEAAAAVLRDGLRARAAEPGAALPSEVVKKLIQETYREALSLTSWVKESFELVRSVLTFLAASERKLH